MKISRRQDAVAAAPPIVLALTLSPRAALADVAASPLGRHAGAAEQLFAVGIVVVICGIVWLALRAIRSRQ